MHEAFEQIEQVAATDSTVLISGEAGTGKELVARAIHQRGERMKHGSRLKERVERIPRAVLAAFEAYSWPGNVRELENVVERP